MAGNGQPPGVFAQHVTGFCDMLTKVHAGPAAELDRPIAEFNAFYDKLRAYNPHISSRDSIATDYDAAMGMVVEGSCVALEKFKNNLGPSIYLHTLHQNAMPWHLPIFSLGVRNALQCFWPACPDTIALDREFEAYVKKWMPWDADTRRPPTDAVAYWQSADVRAHYPLLAQAMLRALAIPTSTVAVKRGFSQQAYLDRHIYRQSMHDEMFMACLNLRCIGKRVVDAALHEAMNAHAAHDRNVLACEAALRAQAHGG
ncbi:MAG: hypothetical protein EOO65_00965, partial [Methanosarcinales archaeon]